MYATKPNKFVTVGGLYGAQPILAEVGMNFYVEEVADDPNNSDPNNKRYYIHSWVHNPTTSHETGTADYLGVKPTMANDERIFPVANDETKKSIYLFVDRGKLNAEDYKDGNGNLINSAPDRINGILSLFLIPVMVIKSILSGVTIWDIAIMKSEIIT